MLSRPISETAPVHLISGMTNWDVLLPLTTIEAALPDITDTDKAKDRSFQK